MGFCSSGAHTGQIWAGYELCWCTCWRFTAAVTSRLKASVTQEQKRKFPASCSLTNAGRFIVVQQASELNHRKIVCKRNINICAAASWCRDEQKEKIHDRDSYLQYRFTAVCFHNNKSSKSSLSCSCFYVFALPRVLCVCLHAQIEYFLRKLTEAMGGSWVEERFEDYKLQLNSKQQSLNAWELIKLVGSGHFSKGMDRQTLSMGINEVYLELILDVLKQVGSDSVCEGSGAKCRSWCCLNYLERWRWHHHHSFSFPWPKQ